MKQVQNMGSVRSQPFAGKSFYFDLPSGKNLEFLAKSVERFGGVVESFLSKEVTCLVSNSQETRKENWRGRQNASLFRKTRAGKRASARLEKSYRDPSHKPAGAVLVTRGKALLQKAIRNQSSTCDDNGVLASARSWGIRIMHTDEMVSYIQRLDLKSGRSARQMKPFPSRPRSAPKVMRLRSPFLKIEDESRRLRPLLQQFKDFPELFFPELRRRSPFSPPPASSSSEAPEGQPAHSTSSSGGSLVPKRQRGYCECCEEDFADLQTHLQSPPHTAFVLDSSHYAPVDKLISEMTNDFVASVWSSLPLRVPLAASAHGEPSGLQGDIAGRTTASSDLSKRSCLAGEGSAEQPASSGSSARFPGDHGFWERMELPWEEFGPPALLTSQSQPSHSDQAGGSRGAERRRRGGAGADSPLEPADSAREGPGAASKQEKAWTARPRKRKPSCRLHGQAKKRPALTRLPPSQPDTNALPGVPPAGTTQRSFPQECGNRTDQGCLWPSAAAAAKPRCPPAPTQFPQEGSARPPQERAARDSSCLTPLVRPLGQQEGFAAHPSAECHAGTPFEFPSMDPELGILGFPGSVCVSSQMLGPVVQPYSTRVDPSPFVQSVVPKRLSPGLPPLSCCEESPSSESEWDRSLLCILEGTSHLPLEHPVDSALLGTCVSLRDSGYESHLSSVLWQTPEPREAH